MASNKIGRCESRGSVLLYVIGAMLLVGAVGAGVAVMSPSSMQSKIEQEAGERAYYNAQSGLSYIISMKDSGLLSVSNFIDTMGDNTEKTYTLADGGQFDYRIIFSGISNDSVTCTIAHLSGQAPGAGGRKSTYLLYGEGKGMRDLGPYTPKDGDGGGNDQHDLTLPEFVLFAKSKLDINTAGEIRGNVYGETIKFNGGSHVYGSVIQASTTEALKIVGRHIGVEGAKICSNSTVVINRHAKVFGDVYSRGEVDINNGVVRGNIMANGDVTLNAGSTVTGKIYATGDVHVKNGRIIGDVYCSGDVVIEAGSSVTGDIHSQGSVRIKNGNVYGFAHYKNSFTACSWCSYGGSDKEPSDFTYEFVCKTDYALPGHDGKEPNKEETSLDVSYGPPDYAAQYTFTATEELENNPDDNPEYYSSFRDFNTRGGSRICFDLSSGGYITMFVSGAFSLQGDVCVKTSPDENCFQGGNIVKILSRDKYSYASKVYLDYSGDADMQFGGASDWFGTIFAKKGIKFSSGGKLVGAFYSSDGTLRVAGGTKVYHVESDYVKDSTWWNHE